MRLLFSLRLDLGGQEGEEAAASVLPVLPLPIVVVVLALLVGTALSEITLVNRSGERHQPYRSRAIGAALS